MFEGQTGSKREFDTSAPAAPGRSPSNLNLGCSFISLDEFRCHSPPSQEFDPYLNTHLGYGPLIHLARVRHVGSVNWSAMARLVTLCLIVLSACVSLHSTLARSTPPVPFYNTTESHYRQLVSNGGGDFTLEEQIAQRILTSRVNSAVEESSNLASYPVAPAAFSSLLLSPTDDEIQEALTGLVRDYMEYRKRVTQLNNEEALLVKEVEARLGTLPPTPVTPPPVTPPPYPEPRFFFFLPSAPPSVNPEGLEGIAAIANDVKQSAEEESFLTKLQSNMFTNSIITTFSFISVEFLKSIGLGDLTSVGTLVADTWLYYEIGHTIREWAERDCYLPSAWPFSYFLPEHCRVYFEEQRQAEMRRKLEQQNAASGSGAASGADGNTGDNNGAGAASGAASGNGAASGPDAGNGGNNDPGAGSGAANGNNENGAAAGNGGENGNGAENGAGAENGENGSGVENGGENGSGVANGVGADNGENGNGTENGGENGSGAASGAGAENGGNNGSGAENGAAPDDGVEFDGENSGGET